MPKRFQKGADPSPNTCADIGHADPGVDQPSANEPTLTDLMNVAVRLHARIDKLEGTAHPDSPANAIPSDDHHDPHRDSKRSRQKCRRSTPRPPSDLGSPSSGSDNPWQDESSGDDTMYRPPKTRRLGSVSRRHRQRSKHHRASSQSWAGRRGHRSRRSHYDSGASASSLETPFDHDDMSLSEDSEKPRTSFGSTVGTTVTGKLRDKILSDKFVDLSELLPDFSSSAQKYTLMRTRDNGARFAREKQKVTLSLDSWREAFNIYMAVYLERAQTRRKMLKLCRAMLTYVRLISDLSKRQYDWAGYDRHFRRYRVAENESWATIRQDLLSTYEPLPNAAPSPHAANKGTDVVRLTTLTTGDGTPLPLGYCRTFHSKGRRCDKGSGCMYKHQCPNCDTTHPVFMPCHSSRRNRAVPGQQIPMGTK